MKRIMAAFVVFAGFSCASIMNPYEDDFQCPKAPNGECVSIETAYERSFDEKRTTPPTDSKKEDSGETVKRDETFDDNGMPVIEKVVFGEQPKEEMKKAGAIDLELLDPETAYQNEVFKEMTALVREPETPIVMAPKTVRVLFLPYKEESGRESWGNDMLFLSRYGYFIIEGPYWLLDGYPEPKE